MAVPLTSDQVQRVIDIGNDVKAQYPRAFSKCHVEGDPERLDFIILFARSAAGDSLLSSTHATGMNGKRGNEEDPSMDVLAFRHNDTTDDRDVTAADVVSGAGGPNAFIYYNDLTDPAGAGAIYIDPFDWATVYDYSQPVPPTPTHTCLLGYSLFYGIGCEKKDPARFDEQLRQYKDHGADCVRIIAHLPRHDANGSLGLFQHIGIEWMDADFVDYIKRADDRLASHGLLWYLTFTAGIYGIETEDKQSQLVDKINEAFYGRGGRRLLDEMANEYEVNGLTTHILRHMCRRNAMYVQRAMWVSLSSPHAAHGGPGDLHDEVRRMYDGLPEANAITPHWDRTVNDPPDLGPYAPSIVWSGEPRGPMSSVVACDDPVELVDDYQECVDAGYSGTIGHSDSGVCSTFHPWPSDSHGQWRLYSDHHNGQACLEALKDFRATGAAPPDTGGGSGGGGGTPGVGDEDKLMPGEVLVPGQAMVSPNRTASVQNQVDGNMTIHLQGVPIWDLWQMELSLGENVPLTAAPGNFKMQEDGNAVLCDAHGNPIWATGTAGNPSAMMQVNDDGYWVMYKDGEPLWRRPK